MSANFYYDGPKQNLCSKALKAEYVGAAQTDSNVVKRVLKGDLQILFISPENLLNNEKFWSMLLTPKYKEN